MKTPLFFIAALVAFIALPIDFTASACALFAFGFMAIALSDYRQPPQPMRALSAVAVGINQHHLRLAA